MDRVQVELATAASTMLPTPLATVVVYENTDEWKDVRRHDGKHVRGIIAQEVNDVFPEHVEIVENFLIKSSGFSLEDFIEWEEAAAQYPDARLVRCMMVMAI